MNPDQILAVTAHRPWPLPQTPWAMRQSWVDLMFAHWRVDPALLRPSVPEPLEIETFDGTAWVGVVPFAIRDLGVRTLPGVPTATDFLELNVRTYVRYNGYSGVYFFSLDASSMIAVAAARTGFGLPYYHAQMKMDKAGSSIVYESARDDGKHAFSATYQPTGNVFHARPESLEHFLTERYALFTVAPKTNVVARVDIHHPPWPLQTADCALRNVSIVTSAGIAIPTEKPLCHFAGMQPVINWAPAPA